MSRNLPARKRVPFDAKRKTIFCEAIRNGATTSEALRACSPHSSARQPCYNTIKEARLSDPEFDQAVIDAELAYCDTLRKVMYRRAVHGTDRPVFQKGEKFGSVREYSDRLLAMLARARPPCIAGAGHQAA